MKYNSFSWRDHFIFQANSCTLWDKTFIWIWILAKKMVWVFACNFCSPCPSPTQLAHETRYVFFVFLFCFVVYKMSGKKMSTVKVFKLGDLPYPQSKHVLFTSQYSHLRRYNQQGNESWVFCSRRRVTPLSWHWSEVHSKTEVPEQRRVVTSGMDFGDMC